MTLSIPPELKTEVTARAQRSHSVVTVPGLVDDDRKAIIANSMNQFPERRPLLLMHLARLFPADARWWFERPGWQGEAFREAIEAGKSWSDALDAARTQNSDEMLPQLNDHGLDGMGALDPLNGHRSISGTRDAQRTIEQWGRSVLIQHETPDFDFGQGLLWFFPGTNARKRWARKFIGLSEADSEALSDFSRAQSMPLDVAAPAIPPPPPPPPMVLTIDGLRRFAARSHPAMPASSPYSYRNAAFIPPYLGLGPP